MNRSSFVSKLFTPVITLLVLLVVLKRSKALEKLA